MKYLIILMIATGLHAESLSQACEIATVEATKTHMRFVNGLDKSLTKSYNAAIKMNKICKE